MIVRGDYYVRDRAGDKLCSVWSEEPVSRAGGMGARPAHRGRAALSALQQQLRGQARGPHPAPRRDGLRGNRGRGPVTRRLITNARGTGESRNEHANRKNGPRRPS